MHSEQASQVALVIKNPAPNTGDLRETGLIPGLGRYPGGGLGNLVEPGGLGPIGSQRVDTTKAT